MKFEKFIYLMEKNWPSAYQNLFILFPIIEKTSNHIGENITDVMKEEGLLSSDFHLLTALRRSKANPPYELMPSELCNHLLFSWGGLTKVMKRLEGKGIITRVDSCHDKRIRMIRLTETGQQIIEEALTQLQRYHKELLLGFTTDEIALLDKLLAKLLNNIESR
ncbi:MAG: hypothetical protein V5789_14325 [Colwellia sp.]